MRYVERLSEAAWSQGQQKRQARRVWAVEAVRADMTDAEWAYALRAVRETNACFEGDRRVFEGVLVDCRTSDYGLAAKVSAARRLAMLRQQALIDTHDRNAAACVEGIVQVQTLPEIAFVLGMWRSRGAGRDKEPDSRKARPLVLDVLTSIAGFYERLSAPHAWRGSTFGPLTSWTNFATKAYRRDLRPEP